MSSMSVVKRSVLDELSAKVSPLELKAFASRLAAEAVQTGSPTSKNPEFFSTKTSFQTTQSIGLRRPVRTKQSLRGDSPAPNPNFSKTVGTTSLQPSKQRAIFYKQQGDLPNLHSQDLLNTLYNKQDGCDSKQGTTGWSRSKFQNINRSLTAPELSNLKQLQLYYCNIESFRSLGTGWKIRSLTIIGASITDFGGISGFALLEDLFVSYNRISDVSHLSYHQTLRSLDLEGNQLADMDQVEYIETVETLEYLNLDYNPVMATDREKIQGKFQHRLDGEYIESEAEQDDLWEAYSGYQQATLIEQINSQLLQDRQNCLSQVILSLQQQHLQQSYHKRQTLPDLPAANSFFPLHTLHKPSWNLNEHTLSYLDCKLLPENMVDGSRSRSKPKLSEILSKDKLVKRDSVELNDMRETRQSFKDQMRESIRAEAKKKFLVRRTSIKKDGGTVLGESPLVLAESMKFRTGRLMQKSCVNRL